MRVHWYCGCFVGSSKWQNVDIYEPDECTAEGEVEVDEEEWNDGEAVIQCSGCGAELTQYMGHLEEVRSYESTNDS